MHFFPQGLLHPLKSSALEQLYALVYSAYLIRVKLHRDTEYIFIPLSSVQGQQHSKTWKKDLLTKMG